MRLAHADALRQQRRVHVPAREDHAHGAVPRASIRSCISAATHGARRLDHELRALQQQHHRLGHLVVGHGHDLVQVALHERWVNSPGRLIAIPSQIVLPVRASAWTPTTRAGPPGRSRCRSRPPPPGGTTTSRTSGSWRAISSPTVPWPATTLAWSNAWMSVRPSSSAIRAASTGRVVRSLHQPHLAAVLAHGRHLGERCGRGHDQRGAGAGAPGGEGDRLGVVAGARGDHAALGSEGDSPVTVFRAPRTLNEPVSWRFSAFSVRAPTCRELARGEQGRLADAPVEHTGGVFDVPFADGRPGNCHPVQDYAPAADRGGDRRPSRWDSRSSATSPSASSRRSRRSPSRGPGSAARSSSTRETRATPVT